MLPRWIIITAFAVIACSGKSSSQDIAMRTFKLVPANNASSAPIDVTMALPGGWKESAEPSFVQFDVPEVPSGSLVSLSMIELTRTPAEQLRTAIELQGLTDGQRTDLSGGRVWIQKATGPMVHGRVFVPYAGGVVMGVAMLPTPDQLPEIRKVFESLTLAAR